MPFIESVSVQFIPPCWELAQIRVGAASLDEVLATTPVQPQSQEARERLDLVKVYFLFINSIVLFNAHRVLAAPQLFEPVIRSLLAGARHADFSMNKTAISVLRRLFALHLLPASVASGEFLLRWCGSCDSTPQFYTANLSAQDCQPPPHVCGRLQLRRRVPGPHPLLPRGGHSRGRGLRGGPAA